MSDGRSLPSRKKKLQRCPNATSGTLLGKKSILRYQRSLLCAPLGACMHSSSLKQPSNINQALMDNNVVCM